MVSRIVKFMGISTSISIGLILLSILSKDIGVFGNIMILVTILMSVPFFLLRYQKYKRVKDIEKKFPDFLRDLTESLRAGLPLHKAIQSASKADYGALSTEIRKMSNQISWGMTIDKVLDQFAERMKNSRRVYTAVKIIKESNFSGGDVPATLEAVADNADMLEDAEKEKKSILSQYVMLMYAVSILFIVIVVAITKLLLPIFSTAGKAGGMIGLSNPCESCFGVSCFVCNLFQVTSSVFGIQQGVSSYYTALFFYMAVIQSIFSGLVAGVISENSVTAGVKHSLILAGIVFGTFSILVRMGLLVV